MGRITLADIGEFAIIRELLFPMIARDSRVTPPGDDCVFVDIGSRCQELVVTTDAAPRPLVWLLGKRSYRTWGWYAVTVNVSDLAAAGATPLAFTSSVDSKPTLSVAQFREFFAGVALALRFYGLANGGGNIRAGDAFSCHATALGLVPRGEGIRRGGAHPGDCIVVIGESGRFAPAYMKAKNLGWDALNYDERKALCRPTARVTEMITLRTHRVVNAGSDSSDGLLGALWNVAERSNCSITLSLDDRDLPQWVIKTADVFGYDPWNYFFCYGDWQVVVAVPGNSWAAFCDLCVAHSIVYQQIGVVTDTGKSEIFAELGNKSGRLQIVRNENFRPGAFEANTDLSLEYMLSTSLWV